MDGTKQRRLLLVVRTEHDTWKRFGIRRAPSRIDGKLALCLGKLKDADTRNDTASIPYSDRKAKLRHLEIKDPSFAPVVTKGKDKNVRNAARTTQERRCGPEPGAPGSRWRWPILRRRRWREQPWLQEGICGTSEKNHQYQLDLPATPRAMSTAERKEWVGTEARVLCYWGGGGGVPSFPSTTVDGINSDAPEATVRVIWGRETLTLTRTRRSVLCLCVFGTTICRFVIMCSSIMGDLSNDANEAGWG